MARRKDVYSLTVSEGGSATGPILFRSQKAAMRAAGLLFSADGTRNRGRRLVWEEPRDETGETVPDALEALAPGGPRFRVLPRAGPSMSGEHDDRVRDLVVRVTDDEALELNRLAGTFLGRDEDDEDAALTSLGLSLPL